VREQFRQTTKNLNKTLQAEVEQLLENYIRNLPFKEQQDYLRDFVRNPLFERLRTEDARTIVFANRLAHRVPRLSRLEKEEVARHLEASLKRRNALRERAHEEAEISEFELTLGDDGPIATAELAEYLLLLNRAYAVGLSVEKEPPLLQEVSDAQKDELVAALKDKLKRTELALVSVDSLKQAEITINRVTKSSPLLIWGVCQMTVLCIAVIVSGGEVNLTTGKFKVNALGDGIRKLRAAFAPSRTPSGKRPGKPSRTSRSPKKRR
jgi:hypothetical protein